MPHEPTPECIAGLVHCHIHNEDERDRPGDYRVCGECWHVFRTATELVRVYRETSQIKLPIYIDPDMIDFCPYCAHLW